MIFEADELAHIRETFRDEVPTSAADIAVWLAASGLAAQHDHLVVNLQEWHDTPRLDIPAWHVGSLGTLVQDINEWATSLAADRYLIQGQVMGQARAAAITALAKMAYVHQALADRWSDPRRKNVLGQIEQATVEARSVVYEANSRLENYLAHVPHGIPRRATVTQATRPHRPKADALASPPATATPAPSNPARHR